MQIYDGLERVDVCDEIAIKSKLANKHKTKTKSAVYLVLGILTVTH